MEDTSPLLRVDLNSPVPVYRQIVNAVRALLVSGELEKGCILPTVRDLAMDLGVHHNTIAEAYRLLAEEGWLEIKRGRGAMVLDRTDPRPSKSTRNDFAKRLRELVAEGQSNGLSAEVLVEELRESIRHFS
ncbi:MAG: GntR family transcriptional regulator [Acidobacteria bacterium]|nr:GntR family transcriptional regulator [Acidobacteriota bacterium]